MLIFKYLDTNRMGLTLTDLGIVKISNSGEIDIDILGAIVRMIGSCIVILFITFLLYKLTGLRSLFIIIACILGISIAIFSYDIYRSINSIERILINKTIPSNFTTVLESNANELKLFMYSILGTTFVFCMVCLYLHSYLGSKPSNIPQNTQVGGKRKH
jgi:DMSO reductase anchor subunit